MGSKIANILLFNLYAGHNADDISYGSNTWQIKNYEELSGVVYALFLGHKGKRKIIHSGNTVVLLAGSGNLLLDLLKAPLIIYKLVQKRKIKTAVTYEQVFLWWLVILLKLFTRCRIVMLPNTLPAMMYKINKKALSNRIPIWIEKILRRISSFFVDIVIIPQSSGEYKNWLFNDWVFKRKTRVIPKVIEGIPSPIFFQAIEKQKKVTAEKEDCFHLLCVSRLRKEKLVEDVLRCLSEIIAVEKNVCLHIIGEGNDKEYFVLKAEELKIASYVRFHGYMPLIDIVPFYAKCNVYISTLTGSALREAALYGMPVVAYEMDWVKDSFQDRITYLGVEPYNYQQLAKTILLLKNDTNLANELAENIARLANTCWSPENIRASYKDVIK